MLQNREMTGKPAAKPQNDLHIPSKTLESNLDL
jgi:hypothetical protein